MIDVAPSSNSNVDTPKNCTRSIWLEAVFEACSLAHGGRCFDEDAIEAVGPETATKSIDPSFSELGRTTSSSGALASVHAYRCRRTEKRQRTRVVCLTPTSIRRETSAMPDLQ